MRVRNENMILRENFTALSEFTRREVAELKVR